MVAFRAKCISGLRSMTRDITPSTELMKPLPQSVEPGADAYSAPGFQSASVTPRHDGTPADADKPIERASSRSIGAISPAQLYLRAVKQGRLADKAWACGATKKAQGHIQKAKELVLLARQIEERK
jgi:hypothetical protein